MYNKITDGFTFHYMEATGTIGMWYHGRRIARTKNLTYGSRQFFKLGKYFIKTEYVHVGFYGQCKEEAYIHNRIAPADKKFFTPMLACDVYDPIGVRWTMFNWYKLVPCDTANNELYQVCRKKVDQLCDKYNIADVAPFVNMNWFIYNGRPLIVDCGIIGGY